MNSLMGLSVQQPWLDMILRGIKTLEIRDRKTIRTRCQVALHSPLKIDFAASYFYGYREPWRLIQRKIVALVEIREICEFDEQLWISTLDQHRQPLPFAGGTYGARLENVQILQHPVPCSGKPGLFPVPPAIASRVLAEARAGLLAAR